MERSRYKNTRPDMERFGETTATFILTLRIFRGDVSILCQALCAVAFTGWWPVDRERGKERERERSGESGREIRDAKHEIYRKLERRATPVRVSTWLFCIQFRLKRRRGFVSLDKFKLEWPCVKVNLWDRLLEEEIFSGCDLKRRKEMFFILFFFIDCVWMTENL